MTEQERKDCGKDDHRYIPIGEKTVECQVCCKVMEYIGAGNFDASDAQSPNMLDWIERTTRESLNRRDNES